MKKRLYRQLAYTLVIFTKAVLFVCLLFANPIHAQDTVIFNAVEIKVSRFDLSDIGKKNTLTIEFKKRLEYVFNPSTNQYEKEEINDTTEIEFPSWETGREYTKELDELWQYYLNEGLISTTS